MAREIFRKTAAGHAEIRQRALGLDARTRGLLILANGELTVEELARRVGFDPLRTLMALLGAGLLEPVPAARPAIASPPAPAPVPPAPPAAHESPSTPPPAPPPAPAPDPDLLALTPADLPAAKTRAVLALAPHYGPDALQMAAPLRNASTPAEFALALRALRERFGAHMGRRSAEQLARQIARG